MGDGTGACCMCERALGDDESLLATTNRQEELTELLKVAAKEPTVHDKAVQMAYELNIDLGRI